MAVEILNAGIQPVDVTWRASAASRSGGALTSDGTGLTLALYDQSQSKWWDPESGVAGAWVVGRVEIDMTEDAGLSGLYSVELDMTVLVPTGERDLLAIITSGDSQDAISLVSFRHNLRSHPIEDEAAPHPLAKLSQVLNLLAASLNNNSITDDNDKRFKILQSDGETVAAQFDLTDAAGNASTREPFARTRVT